MALPLHNNTIKVKTFNVKAVIILNELLDMCKTRIMPVLYLNIYEMVLYTCVYNCVINSHGQGICV